MLSATLEPSTEPWHSSNQFRNQLLLVFHPCEVLIFLSTSFTSSPGFLPLLHKPSCRSWTRSKAASLLILVSDTSAGPSSPFGASDVAHHLRLSRVVPGLFLVDFESCPDIFGVFCCLRTVMADSYVHSLRCYISFQSSLLCSSEICIPPSHDLISFHCRVHGVRF